MTRAWRLTRTAYAASAMTGEGARLYGGRWNPKGGAVVYLAESLPLAALEVLVHTRSPEDLADFVKLPVAFPPDLVEAVQLESLPPDWRSSPPPNSLKAIGGAWLERGASALLRVPSVVVPEAFNFLLNPVHPDMARVVVGEFTPFEFDPRLFS